MKGFIKVVFNQQTTHFIRVKHISYVENKNGWAYLSMSNGDTIQTSMKTEEVVKLMDEARPRL